MGSTEGFDVDFTNGLNCSNFISSGGRNIKSAKRAIDNVMAVNLAMLPFIEKDEKDNTVKPVTRMREVTIKALPTVENEYLTASSGSIW
jgi:hypothetical protein